MAKKAEDRNRTKLRERKPNFWTGYIKLQYDCKSRNTYRAGCRCKRCKKLEIKYQSKVAHDKVLARGYSHQYYPEVQEHLKFLQENKMSFAKIGKKILVSKSSLFRLKNHNIKTNAQTARDILGIGIHMTELKQDSPKYRGKFAVAGRDREEKEEVS